MAKLFNFPPNVTESMDDIDIHGLLYLDRVYKEAVDKELKRRETLKKRGKNK